jgi:hypothetical protein
VQRRAGAGREKLNQAESARRQALHEQAEDLGARLVALDADLAARRSELSSIEAEARALAEPVAEAKADAVKAAQAVLGRCQAEARGEITRRLLDAKREALAAMTAPLSRVLLLGECETQLHIRRPTAADAQAALADVSA